MHSSWIQGGGTRRTAKQISALPTSSLLTMSGAHDSQARCSGICFRPSRIGEHVSPEAAAWAIRSGATGRVVELRGLEGRGRRGCLAAGEHTASTLRGARGSMQIRKFGAGRQS